MYYQVREKNQDFYSLSLSPHGGKLFECNLLFIKWLGFFSFNLFIFIRRGSQKVFKCIETL